MPRNFSVEISEWLSRSVGRCQSHQFVEKDLYVASTSRIAAHPRKMPTGLPMLALLLTLRAAAADKAESKPGASLEPDTTLSTTAAPTSFGGCCKWSSASDWCRPHNGWHATVNGLLLLARELRELRRGGLVRRQ